MIFRKRERETPLHKGPPPLSRNLISYLGWLVCCVVGTLLVVLIGADVLFHSQDVYKSIITYMIVPGVLMGGVGLVLAGSFLEWRRRHKHAPEEYAALPIINFNLAWQRRRVALGTVLLTLVFGLSAITVYQAYHFTESPAFCGKVCHAVMEPEYTTHQFSPHARVSCAECHIGSGANWYVKSKLSGLRQVWAMARHSYHLPIQTPIENLRPARETCEQCHWPEKFTDSLVKVIWHFSPDEANTPMRYTLQLKIGGGDPQLGQGRGIHWHINPDVKIRYWHRDQKRQDIPWIEVQEKGKPARIYRTADSAGSPVADSQPPESADIRVMDCVDCHNRPSHIYQSPREIIDASMSTGVLDGSLPYLKRYATELFEAKYPNKTAALAAIEDTLSAKYAARVQGPRGEELVKRNVESLQKLYDRNFYPNQGVDWREYPDQRSHFESPGCGRCHDGRHLDADSKPIRDDCNLCHTLIDQAEGEAAFEPAVFQRREFVHPRNLGDIWKGYQCWECHRLATIPQKDDAQLRKAIQPGPPDSAPAKSADGVSSPSSALSVGNRRGDIGIAGHER